MIQNEKHDEERAFYNSKGQSFKNIIIAGERDGESAFKECRNITVTDSDFSLRYPFWHNKGLKIISCNFDEGVRAPLWYTENVSLKKCVFRGVKCLRECKNAEMSDSEIESEEFGWRCANLTVNDSSFSSVYFMFECKNLKMKNSSLKGKYSFQYLRNAEIDNCSFDTKDAFWHSKNVTVRNSVINGEYLGWYSENLILENCTIMGTQPFCYCKNLTLINCRMVKTDLAFEYSSVNADVKGEILSVKNPHSGRIVADSYGEIILGDSVLSNACEIVTR